MGFFSKPTEERYATKDEIITASEVARRMAEEEREMYKRKMEKSTYSSVASTSSTGAYGTTAPTALPSDELFGKPVSYYNELNRIIACYNVEDIEELELRLKAFDKLKYFLGDLHTNE